MKLNRTHKNSLPKKAICILLEHLHSENEVYKFLLFKTKNALSTPGQQGILWTTKGSVFQKSKSNLTKQTISDRNNDSINFLWDLTLRRISLALTRAISPQKPIPSAQSIGWWNHPEVILQAQRKVRTISSSGSVLAILCVSSYRRGVTPSMIRRSFERALRWRGLGFRVSKRWVKTRQGWETRNIW